MAKRKTTKTRASAKTSKKVKSAKRLASASASKKTSASATPAATSSKTKAKSAPTTEPKRTRAAKKSTAKLARSNATKGIRSRPNSGSANRKRGTSPLSAALAAVDEKALPLAETGRKLPKTKLTRKQLKDFKELLLAKRSELVGNVSNLTDEALGRNRREAAGDLSSMPIHMADLGSDNWEQEFTLGLLDNERKLLREIDEALARIRDRTYGICLATHNPISTDRLRAKPWAKYCIEYARAREGGRIP